MKNVPVIGTDGRPMGVPNARDALGVLIQEVKVEESLLRDYVREFYLRRPSKRFGQG